MLRQLFYMSLAVDLRRNVKDALVQYRNICQQQHAASLEKVMQHYQKLAEQKANEAAQKAAAATAAAEAASGKSGDAEAVSVDVEDLEEESPESIMLAAMSGEGTKERLDRQILTPWSDDAATHLCSALLLLFASLFSHPSHDSSLFLHSG